MAKTSKTDATDSAVGFYFQACFALIVLLDAADGESVSVETQDDVVKNGKFPRLNQLKHSLGTPAALTEKNDGLWKTIGIWLKLFPSQDHYFVFVTCADINDGHPLLELTQSNGNRSLAKDALVKEAQRVIQAYDKEKAKGKSDLPYKDRIGPCRQFLAQTDAERGDFLERITITHGGFNATKLGAEVQKRLNNYRKSTRPQLAERLLEWWDRRVARSLTREAPREITKEELLERLYVLNDELADDNLPDHFSLEEPPSLASELGTMMEEQIRIIDGGAGRISRAAKARWRARNQRNRWIADSIGIATELDEYDKRMIECWSDLHGPMVDDSKASNDSEKKKAGRTLLDWSHNHACQTVPQPRERWNKAFLTQGTYQQLADELKVGWHPEYQKLLKQSSSAAGKAPTAAKGSRSASGGRSRKGKR